MIRKDSGQAALLAPHASIRTAALVAGLICPLLAHANTVTRSAKSRSGRTCKRRGRRACQPGTDGESALVLRVSNPARRGGSAVATLSYQPQNETVVYQGGSGSATVLRASNFVDVKEPVDMNAPGEIKFKYLPLAQKKLVCQKITGVNKQLVREHTFRISAGFEAAEIAANGNWDWEIVESAQGCDLRIDVAGVYNGNSHRKTVRCPVGTIVKRSDSNYSVVNMFHISYCR